MAEDMDKFLLDALGASDDGEAVVHKKREAKKKTKLVDFHDIEGKLTFNDKPPEKWNKVDLRHYFDHLYKQTFGTRMPYTIPFFYQKSNDVAKALALAVGIKEVPPPMLRDFYDWYFEVHIQKVVAKFNFFKLEWMGKEWIVNEFAQRCGEPAAAKAIAIPETPFEIPAISVDDINEKAGVSFQSVLLAYGLVVAVNWAVVYKKVTVEKAVTVVEKAAVKAVQCDRRFWINIVSATERHGPYPKLLAWTDVDQLVAAVEKAVGGKPLKRIVVESCERNSLLDPLKA